MGPEGQPAPAAFLVNGGTLTVTLRDAPTNPLHTAWVLASPQKGPEAGIGDPQAECRETEAKLAEEFCRSLVPFQDFSAVRADEI